MSERCEAVRRCEGGTFGSARHVGFIPVSWCILLTSFDIRLVWVCDQTKNHPLAFHPSDIIINFSYLPKNCVNWFNSVVICQQSLAKFLRMYEIDYEYEFIWLRHKIVLKSKSKFILTTIRSQHKSNINSIQNQHRQNSSEYRAYFSIRHNCELWLQTIHMTQLHVLEYWGTGTAYYIHSCITIEVRP